MIQCLILMETNRKNKDVILMLELEEANLTLKEYEKKLNELRGSL